MPNIVAVKESAPDPRRFTDLINAFGDRYVLFAGLDDVALEGLMPGRPGLGFRPDQRLPAGVDRAGLTAPCAAAICHGARKIYRWFMPLLHLDAEHDLVQSIKLAETDHGPRLGARAACRACRCHGRAPGGGHRHGGEGGRHAADDWRRRPDAPHLLLHRRPHGRQPRASRRRRRAAADGVSMSERRQDFLARFDWIRTGLMFEPRGHDMMSGGFLYPPSDPANDAAILFIETSGCLPMCGHGTIGMVTFALEHGLVRSPGRPAALRVEVPAGVIEIDYVRDRRQGDSRSRSATWRATSRPRGSASTSLVSVR